MDAPQRLRLLVVPGVTPGRWVDTWRERYPRTAIEVAPMAAADVERALIDGAADVAFVRLPVHTDDLAVIPLWTESTVVVVSRENELSLLTALSPADLAEEVLITPLDDVVGWLDAPGSAFDGLVPPDAGEAVELVAREAGVVVVPAAIARLHQRKDVVALPISGAPESRVGIAWVPVDDEAPPLVDDFVGIVRGRTAASTRGRKESTEPPAKLTAAQRTAAKQARRTDQRKGKPAGRRRSGR